MGWRWRTTGHRRSEIGSLRHSAGERGQRRAERPWKHSPSPGDYHHNNDPAPKDNRELFGPRQDGEEGWSGGRERVMGREFKGDCKLRPNVSRFGLAVRR